MKPVQWKHDTQVAQVWLQVPKQVAPHVPLQLITQVCWHVPWQVGRQLTGHVCWQVMMQLCWQVTPMHVRLQVTHVTIVARTVAPPGKHGAHPVAFWVSWLASTVPNETLPAFMNRDWISLMRL